MLNGVLCLCLFSVTGYAQGDNTPDPLVNLALIDGAVVSGSLPSNQARGIPEDILWDPSTNNWATESDLHEYGMLYDSIAYKTKDDPLWWQVTWSTARNINFITCSGSYPNQPQPTTGWAVQILVEGVWQDLAKAHNGWAADTLTGAGVGIPTQTHWLWDGQLVWKGLEPVVTKGIRFTAYANPASVADGVWSFADVLWSFTWSGRQVKNSPHKAVLIQYLDFSEASADNEADPLLNLALLDEAVVSASYIESTFNNERGQPADILYDPVLDDYHNKNTPWGEFGYPYGYEAGYPESADDGFQYIVEWPVPKKINYFTWGGCYGGQPQPDVFWALQYWNGETWQTLIDGKGGSFEEGDQQWPFTPGIDRDAQSIWMVPLAAAITTTKMRLAAWSDGVSPLWSFHIRCRGGASQSNDDSSNPFKAVLVQYAEIFDPTVIRANVFNQSKEFVLYQNYPNPFNPITTIQYKVGAHHDVPSHVELAIYNLIGQKVATLVSEKQNVGSYKIQWDATGLVSGIYYYQLKTSEFQEIKKMILVK